VAMLIREGAHPKAIQLRLGLGLPVPGTPRNGWGPGVTSSGELVAEALGSPAGVLTADRTDSASIQPRVASGGGR
jgi:hypothetical protein